MFGGGGGGGGGGGAAGGGGGAGAGGGPLEFLRHHPQFQMLRRAVQSNPTILVPMLQELGKQNPELLQVGGRRAVTRGGGLGCAGNAQQGPAEAHGAPALCLHRTASGCGR
jgi:hypothetical protein